MRIILISILNNLLMFGNSNNKEFNISNNIIFKNEI